MQRYRGEATTIMGGQPGVEGGVGDVGAPNLVHDEHSSRGVVPVDRRDEQSVVAVDASQTLRIVAFDGVVEFVPQREGELLEETLNVLEAR